MWELPQARVAHLFIGREKGELSIVRSVSGLERGAELKAHGGTVCLFAERPGGGTWLVACLQISTVRVWSTPGARWLS